MWSIWTLWAIWIIAHSLQKQAQNDITKKQFVIELGDLRSTVSLDLYIAPAATIQNCNSEQNSDSQKIIQA